MDEKIEQKSYDASCDDPDIGDQLLSHINGHTSGDRRMRIEQHVQRCKHCREELKFLRAAKLARQEDFEFSALAFLRQRA